MSSCLPIGNPPVTNSFILSDARGEYSVVFHMYAYACVHGTSMISEFIVRFELAVRASAFCEICL